MIKLVHAGDAHPTFRTVAPIALDGSSRLTFKRLRRPTPLPTLSASGGFGRYLDRLIWLFGGR